MKRTRGRWTLQAQVLPPGESDVDAVLLLDDTDHTPHARGFPKDVEACDARRPRLGSRERREDLHRRRLAGAVRPEQSEDRAVRNGEAEPVERTDATGVRLDEVRGCDCVHGRTVT